MKISQFLSNRKANKWLVHDVGYRWLEKQTNLYRARSVALAAVKHPTRTGFYNMPTDTSAWTGQTDLTTEMQKALPTLTNPCRTEERLPKLCYH